MKPIAALLLAVAIAVAGPAGATGPEEVASLIAGTVTGEHGPEAGVWVIAETTSLPTRFAKIVVTDEQGRFLIPELPRGRYKVWVRGYGLVDSRKVEAEPGERLSLKAAPAPSERDASQYYPSVY